ncbi:unnamed protein product [Amoebophrya sp. A120]|nr:unnamed protein product [Amoebophrya sp. A120]|eukprot:GSA120T00001546001.1
MPHTAGKMTPTAMMTTGVDARRMAATTTRTVPILPHPLSVYRCTTVASKKRTPTPMPGTEGTNWVTIMPRIQMGLTSTRTKMARTTRKMRTETESSKMQMGPRAGSRMQTGTASTSMKTLAVTTRTRILMTNATTITKTVRWTRTRMQMSPLAVVTTRMLWAAATQVATVMWRTVATITEVVTMMEGEAAPGTIAVAMITTVATLIATATAMIPTAAAMMTIVEAVTATIAATILIDFDCCNSG